LFELLFQIGTRLADATKKRLRPCPDQTKTGNVSALRRPFVRQGHLVGTVSGPLSVGGQPRSEAVNSNLTEPDDECVALYSITSSARARRVSGTLRPNALAVLRLIAI
jgi:hypothetical protein